MTVEVVQFSPSYSSEWNEFVRTSDQSTFGHDAGWSRAVRDTYHHQMKSLVALENGRITGVLPLFLVRGMRKKKLVSVPFSSYGGTCADAPDVRDALVSESKVMCDEIGADMLELRSIRGEPSQGFSSINGYSTFILDLSPGPDKLYSNCVKTVRNRIRRAEKQGLDFVVGNDRFSEEEFYEMYLGNQRDLGTPAHDKKFFTCIRAFFPNDVYIMKAYKDDIPVASLFTLKFRDTIIVIWSASREDYSEYSPGNFVYWQAIKYASEKGIHFLDFGRSTVGSGVYQFKQRWNGKEILLKYSRYPDTGSYQIPQEEYKSYAKIWSKIPLSVTRVLGPRIRKYVV